MQKTTLGIMIAGLLGATPVLAETIDLMVLHTPGLAAYYRGNVQTRIQHLINVTNQTYANSGLDLKVRVVYSQEVNYPEGGDSLEALKDLTQQRVNVFRDVPALRKRYGADMVVLLRPYQNNHGNCGVAWIAGVENRNYYGQTYQQRTEGDLSQWANSMFSHVSATQCSDITLVHELGHNMGLNHSRLQDGSGGTFHYALGHGVRGSFATVMAYPDRFEVQSSEYKFSSPALTCKGQPCGVDYRDQANGADAVRALRVTAPQVAAFYPVMANQSQPYIDELDQSWRMQGQNLENARTFYGEQVTAKAALEKRQTLLETHFEQYQHDLGSLGQRSRDAINESNRLARQFNSQARKGQDGLISKINALREKGAELGSQYNELAKRYQGEVAEYNGSWARHDQLVAAVSSANEKMKKARSAVEKVEQKYMSALSRQPAKS